MRPTKAGDSSKIFVDEENSSISFHSCSTFCKSQIRNGNVALSPVLVKSPQVSKVDQSFQRSISKGGNEMAAVVHIDSLDAEVEHALHSEHSRVKDPIEPELIFWGTFGIKWLNVLQIRSF